MNRRLALTVLAASALVAAPTAAMAYDAPGFTTTTTDPTPVAGESFTLATAGVPAGESGTLTITSNPASLSNDSIEIAGTKSSTKVATADGISWTVSLDAAGTYTAAVTDSQGTLIGDEVLTIAGAGGTTAAPTLSETGFDGAELALGAGALVLAGAGAVLVARRRQAALAR